jgi:hypothetical protein
MEYDLAFAHASSLFAASLRLRRLELATEAKAFPPKSRETSVFICGTVIPVAPRGSQALPTSPILIGLLTAAIDFMA